MYLLYDIILFLSAVILLPFFGLRSVLQGEKRLGIRQRIGIYPQTQLQPLQGRKVFWVHAVSVGETRAAIPLVKALKKAWPECALVLSNTTQTGHAIGCDVDDVDLCLYFPFDHSWVIKRVLRQIAPSLIVIVETELWPNFIRHARRSGIPVAMVNGRISDRSFPRYRFFQWFLRPLLQLVSAFCMQSEADAEKVRALGATGRRMEVTGNLKFDMQIPVPGDDQVEELKKRFGLPRETAIWVAGSTHAGEEELIVDNYRTLIEEGHRLFLILAPRHLERCRAVAEMIASRDLSSTRRSDLEKGKVSFNPGEILLVDTMGELLNFYALSDMVFVGGSLVPVGGHNVLEAALVKKPVLFGPHMGNFKEISALLLNAGGGLRVRDRHELLNMTRQLLQNPQMRTAMGNKGHALIREHSGATEKTLEVIRSIVESDG